MAGTQRSSRRRLDVSAPAALFSVLALVPVWLVALTVFWVVVRIWWKVPLWMFAAGYLVTGIALFLRPVQRYVLGPLLGARAPTPAQRAYLDTAWRSVLQRNALPSSRYVVMVLPADELNAFACGGHLVIVTSFALDELPRDELCGVLAHELSHHLGMHTVALTAAHWLSVPILILAKIGEFLQNVAAAATHTFARSSSTKTIGEIIAALLMAASQVFVAGLNASRAIATRVGRSAEYLADRRAVQMGYGRELASALRRVSHIAPAGEPTSTSHPPAKTRIAKVEGQVRKRQQQRRPQPDPLQF